MTRSELIAKLASRYRSLTAADVEASVSIILTAIAEKLAEGGRVEIRGFGTFTANYRPPRIGHNPATLAPVSVPAKYAPHFKPGRELRDRVAASAKSEKPTPGTHQRTRANAELTPVD
jgi:integration host factor subunit beta